MAQNGQTSLRLPRSHIPENCPLRASRGDDAGSTTLHLPWQGEAYRKLMFALPQGGGSKSISRRPDSSAASGSTKANAQAAKESDASPDEEKARLYAPQWLTQNADKSSDKGGYAVITASPTVKHVWVACSAENLMPGDTITFHLYLKAQNGGQDTLLDQVSGKVESTSDGDIARAKYFIADGNRGKPFEVKRDQFYFIAKQASKKLDVRSADLNLEANTFALWLELDVDNPKAKDDVVVLLDAGHQEVKRFKLAEMKESQPDRVRLVLGDLPRGEKISLIRDLGPDEEGGQEILVEDLTPDEITEQFGEIA
jgi:hypothetical protein